MADAHSHPVMPDSQSSGAAGNVSADDRACPICASCCNLVALTQPPAVTLGASFQLPQPVAGPSRFLTRFAPIPDKPPRA